MTTATLADAFFATVDDEHKIMLPSTIPSGAKVAVIVMSSDGEEKERRRQEHLSAALNIVNSLKERPSPSSDISDQDLSLLIKSVRRKHQTK